MRFCEFWLYALHFCLWWITFYETVATCSMNVVTSSATSAHYVCAHGDIHVPLTDGQTALTTWTQRLDILGSPIADTTTMWKFIFLVFPVPLYPFLLMLSLQFL